MVLLPSMVLPMQVVSNWARDFDAEAVFANERSAVIAHLPSMEEGGEGAAAAGAAGGSGRREFFQLESLGGAQVRARRAVGRSTSTGAASAFWSYPALNSNACLLFS